MVSVLLRNGSKLPWFDSELPTKELRPTCVEGEKYISLSIQIYDECTRKRKDRRNIAVPLKTHKRTCSNSEYRSGMLLLEVRNGEGSYEHDSCNDYHEDARRVALQILGVI